MLGCINQSGAIDGASELTIQFFNYGMVSEASYSIEAMYCSLIIEFMLVFNSQEFNERSEYQSKHSDEGGCYQHSKGNAMSRRRNRLLSLNVVARGFNVLCCCCSLPMDFYCYSMPLVFQWEW